MVESPFRLDWEQSEHNVRAYPRILTEPIICTVLISMVGEDLDTQGDFGSVPRVQSVRLRGRMGGTTANSPSF